MFDTKPARLYTSVEFREYETTTKFLMQLCDEIERLQDNAKTVQAPPADTVPSFPQFGSNSAKDRYVHATDQAGTLWLIDGATMQKVTVQEPGERVEFDADLTALAIEKVDDLTSTGVLTRIEDAERSISNTHVKLPQNPYTVRNEASFTGPSAGYVPQGYDALTTPKHEHHRPPSTHKPLQATVEALKRETETRAEMEGNKGELPKHDPTGAFTALFQQSPKAEYPRNTPTFTVIAPGLGQLPKIERYCPKPLQATVEALKREQEAAKKAGS